MKLVVFVILLTSAVQLAVGCDTAGVEQCLANFTTNHPQIKEKFSVKYTEQQLTNMCDGQKLLTECGKGKIENCTTQEVKKEWDMIHLTATYLCTNESKIIFADYGECLRKNETTVELQKCITSYTTESSNLTDGALCNAMKTFRKCSTDAIKTQCGSNSSVWYGGLLDSILEPTKEGAKNCTEGEVKPVEACDAKGFEQCVTNFTTKYPTTTNEFSVSYTEQQLTKMCNDYKVTAECAKEKIKNCSENVRKMWDSIHMQVNYLCSEESKKIIAKHGTCLEKNDLKTPLDKCISTYKSEASKLKDTPLCNAMKTFGTCSTGVIKTHCGSEASEWYGDFLDNLMEPAKKAIKDCNFTAGSGVAQYSTILLTLALLLTYYSSS